MSFGGGMQTGGAGGAGIPDMEGSMEQIDPNLLAAIMAGAVPGGPMGMMGGGGPPCPMCGAPMEMDGSCPSCGMGPEEAAGNGTMDPETLSALLGGGSQGPPPGGVEAVLPPGDTDTTGADGDQANLQQLLAMLQMMQGQGGGAPGGGMPSGMGGPPSGMGGGPPPGMGGGPPPGMGRPNPLLAAMGRG